MRVKKQQLELDMAQWTDSKLGAPDRHLTSTVSHFISDYQSLDQHLSTTLSAPVIRVISACPLLDHCPLSRLKSANAAAR